MYLILILKNLKGDRSWQKLKLIMNFALVADKGKAYVKNQEGCSTCNCEEAINNCPDSAISWD